MPEYYSVDCRILSKSLGADVVIAAIDVSLSLDYTDIMVFIVFQKPI